MDVAKQYLQTRSTIDIAEDKLLMNIDKYSYRLNFDQILSHVKEFISKDNQSNRWFVISGLRGVGKTTLVLQIYKWLFLNHKDEINLIYFSLDKVQEYNIDLLESLHIYEQILGQKLSQMNKLTFIFIDEIQVNNRWAKILKTIYDDNPNIFFICTGSSATYLQLTADVYGRRAKVIKLLPLSFAEYQMFDKHIAVNNPLRQKLLEIIYYSQSANKVYASLNQLTAQIQFQLKKYDFRQLDDYLKFANMPLVFDKDVKDVYTTLQNSIKAVIQEDLTYYGRDFTSNTSLSIKKLLIYLATSSDILTFNKLTKLLKLSHAQLDAIFNALVTAELLVKIPAFGKEIKNAKKPVRYNFISSSLRYSYFDIVGHKAVALARRGLLLEDMASLHYYKEFSSYDKGQLTYYYDNHNGGHCDFILKLADDTNIALEFGLPSKDDRQINQTMSKINNCKYGLVFAKNHLELSNNQQVVSIPLEYFFLM
ncbi:MAG: AAA family ATPase [Candidatus Saccharibacteria bacterium]|nr:AAA family ATPase [Candidatus Saccharibacteria bacterium]